MVKLSNIYYQPFVFLFFLGILIIILCFLIPPTFLNYLQVNFLNIISISSILSIEFEEYAKIYLFYLPNLVSQLSNEISRFIFNFFLLLKYPIWL